jgi:glycosyltransferase involved in cell wall biosynthesis
MRIGIDARELVGHATGAGRYLGGLLHEWAADGRRRHEFVLYAADRPSIGLDARRFVTRLVAGHPGTWWEQVHLPRAAAADNLDVFFAPAYTAPLWLRVPLVAAIHDISYVAHPEWFRTREGVRRRWLTRQTARRAGAVVTISEFSRRELVEKLGVPSQRIAVIPPGVRAPPVQSSAPEERILFVGSVFNRRHVPDLIRAFGIVARERPRASLDLVGDNRTYPREDLQQTIHTEGLDGRVRWHQYTSEERLRELYAGARAFAFLSEYEGLGLTPLEALAAGVPPVLLDTPVARESCGNAAIYVRQGDLEQTAHALERVLVDEGTRRRLLDAAPQTLARYSWPEAARKTLEILEQAGTSASPPGTS